MQFGEIINFHEEDCQCGRCIRSREYQKDAE
jgi:hypothetical protein